MNTVRLERLVRQLVDQYQHELNLQHLTLHIEFEPHENREEEGVANTNGEPQYQEAWLSFDIDAMEADAEKRLEAGGLCCKRLYYERTVRHELAHAATWRFLRTAEIAAGKRKALQKIIEDEFDVLATWVELLPHWRHRCGRRRSSRSS